MQWLDDEATLEWSATHAALEPALRLYTHAAFVSAAKGGGGQPGGARRPRPAAMPAGRGYGHAQDDAAHRLAPRARTRSRWAWTRAWPRRTRTRRVWTCVNVSEMAARRSPKFALIEGRTRHNNTHPPPNQVRSAHLDIPISDCCGRGHRWGCLKPPLNCRKINTPIGVFGSVSKGISWVEKVMNLLITLFPHMVPWGQIVE